MEQFATRDQRPFSLLTFWQEIKSHLFLYDKMPKYLTDCCVTVSDIAGHQRLHSAHRHQLDVPHYQQTILGRRGWTNGLEFTCRRALR